MAFELSTGTAAAALDGTEKLPILQGGAARAATAAQVKALANALEPPVVISASTLLDSSHYGKLIAADTASIALTFPSAPATVEVLRVVNISGGNVTVNGVAVSSGRDITFVSIDSAWVRFEPQVDAGTSLQTSYISGRWYALNATGYATGPALIANRLSFEPFILPHDMTVSELGIRVLTPVTGSTAQVALYLGNEATGRPTGAVLTNTVDLSTAAAGYVSAGVANVTLSAGQLYFAAIVSTGAIALASEGGTSLKGSLLSGGATLTESLQPHTRIYSGTYGVWPDMTAISTSTGGAVAFIASARVA